MIFLFRQNFGQLANRLLILQFCFLLGCASDGRNKQGDISAASGHEIMLGQQIHAQIISSYYPYTEPALMSYVNSVGKKLYAQESLRKLPYQVTVLYDQQIYATSAPGGYIYVTTGMLNFLESESELAAVLGHEIGELQARFKKISLAKGKMDTVSQSGLLIGSAFGPVGLLAGLGFLAMGKTAGYVIERKQGLEAALIRSDQIALKMMVNSGYDPEGFNQFFMRFLKADSSKTPFFFNYYQSRPLSEKRIESLAKNINKLPLQNKTLIMGRDLYAHQMTGIREMYRPHHPHPSK